MDTEDFQRLPTTVSPSNYALKLRPDLTAFTFSGNVEIALQVKESTSVVVLNSAELEIQSAKFTSNTGSSVEAAVKLDENTETASFIFPSVLEVGSGVLCIEYTGILNDRMKGFYRSKYTTPEGETRYAATTQFEPTDARRALPCWDEPAVKSTFDVTLVVPKDRVALSNMPIVKDEPLADDPSLRLVTFDRTPIMSTYLLAFIVGEYDFIEEKDADGVLVRVYTPVGKKEQGRFALKVAVKTLPFYKKYFGLPYPLPKVDLIGISDFSAGAMENWGLITYRENRVLVDSQQSSIQSKVAVALVVGHELAHMWFGNLVTMEWWTHLWLNEGFAKFIEYMCVDFCFPEHNIWHVFVMKEVAGALGLDGLASSHPIEVAVKHPSEVQEIFDAISYSKGASVIRMLHNWVGDEAFRKGLNAYLTKFQYKNAFTEDLWASLGEASGLPVAEVMSTWTAQMGYPVISVSERQEGDNRVLTVSQEKFCADGKKPDTDFTWHVPLKFIVSGKADSTVTYLLKEKSGEVVIANVQAGDVIKVNPESFGFYRVKYERPMMDSLIRVIPQLSPLDRLSLVADSFSLARAGLQSVVEALKLCQSFEDEKDFNVWATILGKLGGMQAWVMDTDFYPLFIQFCTRLLEKVLLHVGWEKAEGEGTLDSMLRASVLGKMGRLGHKATVTEAQRRFDLHQCGDMELSADLRSAVYGTLLKSGPTEYFDKIWKVYETTSLQEEKIRILSNIGAVEDEQRLVQVIKYALSDKVRSGDLPILMGGLSGSVKGRDVAWNFYKDNHRLLIEKYQGGFLLRRALMCATDSFCDEASRSEIEAFMKENPAPATERTVQQSLESIRISTAVKQRESVPVGEFLRLATQ